MDISVAFTGGKGKPSRPFVAFDGSCQVTVSGLSVESSTYAYLTTRDGATALANRALITANSATLNLNTSTMQAFVPVGATAAVPALLTLRRVTTGEIIGLAEITIAPSANPNADVTRVGIDYATETDVANLQAQIDAIDGATPSDDDPLALAEAAAPGAAEDVSRSDHVHPLPSAADVGAVPTSHLSSHPVPTNRDTRNYRVQTPSAVAEKSGASVAPDFETALTLQWTLTGNLTSFAAATNLADGETGMVLITIGASSLPADPPSGAYKGAWTVTGTLVRVVIERIGSTYLWSADSLEVVS